MIALLPKAHSDSAHASPGPSSSGAQRETPTTESCYEKVQYLFYPHTWDDRWILLMGSFTYDFIYLRVIYLSYDLMI